MQLPEARSGQLATRLLALNPTELKEWIRQLHPEDLAQAWQALPPWSCRLVWERYRRVR
jgi:hypothetical protein